MCENNFFDPEKCQNVNVNIAETQIFFFKAFRLAKKKAFSLKICVFPNYAFKKRICKNAYFLEKTHTSTCIFYGTHA